jgi:hypothetical protein
MESAESQVLEMTKAIWRLRSLNARDATSLVEMLAEEGFEGVNAEFVKATQKVCY